MKESFRTREVSRKAEQKSSVQLGTEHLVPLLPSANTEQLQLPPKAALMLTGNDEGIATPEHKHVWEVLYLVQSPVFEDLQYCFSLCF